MLGANITKKKKIKPPKLHICTFHNTQGTISEYAIHECYFYRMTKRHYGDWTAFPA